MALFKKKKKEMPVSNDNNSLDQGNDVFDRIFDDDDSRKKEMLRIALENQPKTISENHKNFVSDFDDVMPVSEVFLPTSNNSDVESVVQKTAVVHSSDASPQVPITASDSDQNKCDNVFGLSSVIGKRDSQQDAAAVSDYSIKSFTGGKWMAILCDGMGGMNGGERASELCVEKMLSYFSNISDTPIPEFYRNSIIDTDYAVVNLKDDMGNYLGAGSTLVSVTIDGDDLYWASVGDSHIYVIRGKEMIRVNAEHNYMMELMEKIKRGEITIEEANNDKNREALISYMGIGNISLMDINTKPFKLLKGDFVVLCSDGLYRSVSDSEIYNIVVSNANDMQKASSELTECALSKNKKYQDNTTVIAIRYM